MPNLGWKPTEEQREHMRLSQIGRKHSDATKLKMSISGKGRIFSEMHRKNLSKALKGRLSGNNHPMFGKHHTEETKRKIGLANLGNKFTDEAKLKMGLSRRGENNPRWNGGKRIHQDGYVYVKSPNHPSCHHDGYILEHRLVMERHIGRLLKRKEIVHHINGDVSDNRIENLMIFPNITAHLNFHKQIRKELL